MSLSLGLPLVSIFSHATVVYPQMSGARGNDEVEYQHNNSSEEQVPFDPSQNPQRRKRKRKLVRRKYAQGDTMQPSYVKGRLNYMDSSNLHGVKKVVGGYVQIDSVQVYALFDQGATHSFISAKTVESYKMMKCPTRRPLMVHTPVGEILADQICPNISFIINRQNFTATLIVLESMDIPVVFGNGWLCAHKAVVQANLYTVHLTSLSGERVEYRGGPLGTERIESQGGPLGTKRIECLDEDLLQTEEVDDWLEDVHSKAANMNNGISTKGVEGQTPLE